MSAAVMALAETSKSYRKRIDELETEVACLQALNTELNHSFGLYDLGAERDAKRIAELQKDLAEAQGYGHALYAVLDQFCKEHRPNDPIPKPPWLAPGLEPVGGDPDRENLGGGI